MLYSVVALALSQLQGKDFQRPLKANTSSEKVASKFKSGQRSTLRLGHRVVNAKAIEFLLVDKDPIRLVKKLSMSRYGVTARKSDG